MEPENDQVKQQSEQHLKDLQKRRILEERRAAFYAERTRELEQAQEAQRVAKEDKQEKRQKLNEQILLAKRVKEGRAA